MRQRNKLVFHLWLPSDMTEKQRKMYDFHFKCLKCFSKGFDKSFFYIAVDSEKNIELLSDAITKIYDLGINETKIEIGDNDSCREGKTFYDEVVSKMDIEETHIFFGHSKGLSNVETYPEDMIEYVYKTVGFVYYMNLSNIEYINDIFNNNRILTSGTLLLNGDEIQTKNKWMYAGTFYWINTPCLYNYINMNNIFIPKLDNRLYAEEFLGNTLPFNFKKTVNSLGERYYLDYYDNNDLDNMIEFLSMNKYEDFKKWLKSVKD